jgi:ribosomal protein S18 acetylase RimI-like enzyme
MAASHCLPCETPSLEFQKLDSKSSLTTLARLRAIERKSFPRNEIFDSNTRLLGKQNISILYASLQLDSDPCLVAYAVCVQWSKVLLQKLCVAESFRGRGIGKTLMLQVMARARRARCSAIELWVDGSRTVARGLYSSCGFQDIEYVPDYYTVGRHGIKMRNVLLP